MSVESRSLPLYVDLDGTLIYSDCLYESFLRLIRLNPFAVFLVFVWLLKGGRQYMKAQIAERVDLDVENLPYNGMLIEWLHKQKSEGREIILATASHRKYAELIAAHVGLFSRVLASDQDFNLKGRHKASRLLEEAGEKAFDYVGDSKADLNVWAVACAAIIVSNSAKLVRSARSLTQIERLFPSEQQQFSLAVLRPMQWWKNVLLFVPLIATGQLLNGSAVVALLTSFIAFSLCASSAYILNDLLKLEEDRKDLHKKQRPLAAGKLSIVGGIIMLLCLLLGGFAVAYCVNPSFMLWLGLYYFLALVYSLYLERIKIADILSRLSLYLIRVFAGAAAINVPVSAWMPAF